MSISIGIKRSAVSVVALVAPDPTVGGCTRIESDTEGSLRQPLRNFWITRIICERHDSLISGRSVRGVAILG